MQLLIEEFFKKIFNYINGINLFIIRWAVKFIFYVVLSGVVAYIILSALRHNYFPVSIFFGILLIGEIAHYLRKSREKTMVERVTEENSVNKKPENYNLLKVSKSKNKGLIKKRKVEVVKGVSVGGKEVKGVDKTLIKTEKAKNDGLLKVSKSKNNGLLEGV